MRPHKRDRKAHKRAVLDWKFYKRGYWYSVERDTETGELFAYVSTMHRITNSEGCLWMIRNLKIPHHKVIRLCRGIIDTFIRYEWMYRIIYPEMPRNELLQAIGGGRMK